MSEMRMSEDEYRKIWGEAVLDREAAVETVLGNVDHIEALKAKADAMEAGRDAYKARWDTVKGWREKEASVKHIEETYPLPAETETEKECETTHTPVRYTRNVCGHPIEDDCDC